MALHTHNTNQGPDILADAGISVDDFELAANLELHKLFPRSCDAVNSYIEQDDSATYTRNVISHRNSLPRYFEHRVTMLSTLRPAARAVARPQSHVSIKFAATASTFANVKEGPPDAILGITEAFKKDSFGQKINLGVGAYRKLHWMNNHMVAYMIRR